MVVINMWRVAKMVKYTANASNELQKAAENSVFEAKKSMQIESGCRRIAFSALGTWWGHSSGRFQLIANGLRCHTIRIIHWALYRRECEWTRFASFAICSLIITIDTGCVNALPFHGWILLNATTQHTIQYSHLRSGKWLWLNRLLGIIFDTFYLRSVYTRARREKLRFACA